MNKKYARSVNFITLLHPASCYSRPWPHRLVFAVSAFILFTATAADIPFWGQANPPTNRVAAATTPAAVPAGTDFRCVTSGVSGGIPLNTFKAGGMCIFFR